MQDRAVIAAKPRAAVRPAASETGRRWSTRLPALLLAAAILVSLGGGGLMDVGSAYALEGRAQALHARWAYMLDNGIPSSDLAQLQREWSDSRVSELIGTPVMFWLPG